jgi:hypothetical protein
LVRICSVRSSSASVPPLRSGTTEVVAALEGFLWLSTAMFCEMLFLIEL